MAAFNSCLSAAISCSQAHHFSLPALLTQVQLLCSTPEEIRLQFKLVHAHFGSKLIIWGGKISRKAVLYACLGELFIYASLPWLLYEMTSGISGRSDAGITHGAGSSGNGRAMHLDRFDRMFRPERCRVRCFCGITNSQPKNGRKIFHESFSQPFFTWPL